MNPTLAFILIALFTFAFFIYMHEDAHAQICREYGGEPKYLFMAKDGDTIGLMAVQCSITSDSQKQAQGGVEATYTLLPVITAMFMLATWLKMED